MWRFRRSEFTQNVPSGQSTKMLNTGGPSGTVYVTPQDRWKCRRPSSWSSEFHSQVRAWVAVTSMPGVLGGGHRGPLAASCGNRGQRAESGCGHEVLSTRHPIPVHLPGCGAAAPGEWRLHRPSSPEGGRRVLREAFPE